MKYVDQNFELAIKIHMCTHTGEKAFSCEVYRSSFSLSPNLSNPMHIQLGENPHPCIVCGSNNLKGFRFQKNLIKTLFLARILDHHF